MPWQTSDHATIVVEVLNEVMKPYKEVSGHNMTSQMRSYGLVGNSSSCVNSHHKWC